MIALPLLQEVLLIVLHGQVLLVIVEKLKGVQVVVAQNGLLVKEAPQIHQ